MLGFEALSSHSLHHQQKFDNNKWYRVEGTFSGKYYVKGKIQDEFVLTCYVCHPSLCNDSLSGTVLITFIAKLLSKIKKYYSYRFLFIPETIGAIAWLSKNESNIKKISTINIVIYLTCT